MRATFYFLSLTLRAMPVGVAYAIWSGLGIVLIALIGLVWFGQKLDLPALIGLGADHRRRARHQPVLQHRDPLTALGNANSRR